MPVGKMTTRLNIRVSDRFRRLSKEGFWIVFGNATAIVGTLVGVRVLTELLSPAAYGELALGMSLAILVNQAVLGPLSNGIIRFYAPADESGELGGYYRAVFRLVLQATAIIGLISIVTLMGLLAAGKLAWVAIVLAALAFATLNGYNVILSGIQNAARQRAVVALHQGLESWIRWGVAAGLIILLGASSTVAMVGYVVSVAIVLVSQYLLIRRDASTPSNVESVRWQRDILEFSWPISIFGIFTWFQLASDRWALGLISSTDEVGKYAVLFQLGYQPISLAAGLAMQFITPIIYQRAGDANDSRRNAEVSKLGWNITGVAFGMTVAAFGLALIFHEQIFGIFAAQDYKSVSYLLPWMLLSGGSFAVGQTMALNMMGQMKTHAMMKAKIVTAIAGVGMNFAGAYWYGTVGIIGAGLVFSISYAMWMVVLLKTLGKNK